MDDFNEYISHGDDNMAYDGNIFNLVNSLAKKFDGKSQNELLSAIYKEALKGKRNGTLTNDQIDKFASMLSPFLDDKKRGYLKKIVEELKKIQ